MKKLILQVWAVLAALAFQGAAAPVAVPVAAVAAVAVADIVAPPPALATEANPDPGFNTPVLHMPMGATPQPAVSSGKLHFTSAASSMTMDMISAPLVKTYHKYRVSWTVSGYASGNVQVVLAKPMLGVANGTTIPAVDIHGLAPIASNFDRSLGLDHGLTPPTPPASPGDDTESAFRIMWSAGPVTPNDPEVYNNQQGVSHLHQFLCNTWLPYHPEANYGLSRAHGSTTCGNIIDPRYPENRSSYWFPALIDVVDGYAVLPHGNLYYKRYWSGSRHCFTDSMAGSCAEIPHGLRMITCYDFSNGTFDGCPMSWTGGTYVGPDLQSAINGAYAAGGDRAPILFSMQWPACWNGINVDTPNHRSHMAFPQGDNSCPETHPYRLATISLQIFFNINADAVAGHWHLSSDEMLAGWTSAKGSTGHMDYFEAWDPTTIHLMHTQCEDVGISSADGALCDDTAVKDGDKLTQSGGASVPSLDTFRPTLNTIPLGTTGYSKGCHANGTCTDEITAGADGVIMVVCSDGCVADVDDVTVTPIASGTHGPVTVHN
jgi:hypothetical protein